MSGDSGCVWTPLPSGSSLTIEINPTPHSSTPSGQSTIDAEWDRLCAENPRYFNGPILAYREPGPTPGTIRADRDEFKRLAVRPKVETGVIHLGVTGVLEARDVSGRPHVLMGRRSHQTRVFGGMWELGPSGGIDPPPAPQRTMDAGDVWNVLINEIREEVGLRVDPDPAPPVGLLLDPVGGSMEVVVRVTIARPIEELLAAIEDESGTNRWEYDAVRWVAIDELTRFARTQPVIAATRAVWRGLGWH